MPYLKIDEYDLDLLRGMIQEDGENISLETLGETLSEEMMIESFLDNLDKITPAKLDEFLKTL